MPNQGLFTWRKVDPRRWINFTLGLHATILVRVLAKYRMFEKELKMAGDKNKHTIWALLLSLLALTTSFQYNYHNNQLVVTPNEVVGLYCRDQPLNDPPLFLSVFFSLVLGSSQRRQFTWCSDQLGRSQYQEDPSSRIKYNPLHVSRIQKKAYGARMICLLGSSWYQDVPPFM